MNDFQDQYVKNLSNYFGSKLEDDKRIFRTINRYLDYNNLTTLDKIQSHLDLGSGKGTFVEVCKSNGVKSCGLDGAKDKVNFETDKLKFEDNSFDLISMINLIEHLKDSKVLMDEVKRVAKNNCILVVCTPNFRYCYKTFYNDPTHVSPYTDTSLREFLTNHGMEKVNIGPMVVDKSKLFWKLNFKFFLASIIPFTNHSFRKSKLIPGFLRGKSTSLISVSVIKK